MGRNLKWFRRTWWRKIILELASHLHKSEPHAFRPTRYALQLVRGSDCSGYDCEFVALAQKLNTQLVTMDKKLLRAFPKCAVALPTGL